MALGLAVALLGVGPPASGTSPASATTLRMQVLLDRARFSPGEIDGTPGSNSSRALAAYAEARGLVAGEAAFWAASNDDATPTLVAYTLTESDLAAISATAIPEDMMEKASLDALGYASVIEALGEKFHSSPGLLRRLNPQASWTRAGESIEVPNVRTDLPADKVARVIIDESDLAVLTLDAEGRVFSRYPATLGSAHDPLPLGEWKVQGVQQNPPFFYNPDLFWDADETHAKARIAPGPNNPVGVVWIDLSKPHFGIHGTPEPSAIAKTQSHGCIRLTNWDAAELASLVSPGMPVVLQE
jgi:lipoprotein-anchoring transpeptidase ErfK/SrfK